MNNGLKIISKYDLKILKKMLTAKLSGAAVDIEKGDLCTVIVLLTMLYTKLA